MPDIITFAATGVITRIRICNSSGQNMTGLTTGSSGLVLSTIANVESTPTNYTVGRLESISTLGTYSAPTSGYARFAEVDATFQPGVYEIQLADARWAVSGAKELIITVSGVADIAPIPLKALITQFDLQTATPIVKLHAAQGDITWNSWTIGPIVVASFVLNNVPMTFGTDGSFKLNNILAGVNATIVSGTIPAATNAQVLTAVNTQTGGSAVTQATLAASQTSATGGLQTSLTGITATLSATGSIQVSLATINAVTSSTGAIQTNLLTINSATSATGGIQTSLTTISTATSAIKVVTDKLATTLNAGSGSTFIFSAAALALAPSGGGGGNTINIEAETTYVRSQ